MRTTTKAQTARLDKLCAIVDAARDAVYGEASDNNTALSLCLKMAKPEVAAAYRQALDNVAAYERELIADGRGYRSAYGFRSS